MKLILAMLFIVLTGFGMAQANDLLQQNNLPIEISNELEKISGIKIGFATLINSSNAKQIKHFKHKDAVKETIDGPLAATILKKITSISVIEVPDVEVAGKIYQFCNYINIDGQMKLICANNTSEESEESQTSERTLNLPIELAAKLEKIGEIDNLGFLVLTDIVTGETKLLKQENYIYLPTSLPQAISEITSISAWGIVSFKLNPCKICNVTGGQVECLYIKDSSC